jgi:hypothetical protein
MFFDPEPTDSIILTAQTRKKASVKKDETCCLEIIRKSLQRQGVPTTAIDIIMQSWRKSTKKQYASYIKSWISFCGKKYNPFKPSVNQILAFFVVLYRKGRKFSVFQTARAAINNLTALCGGNNFSDNQLMKRFLSGIFTLRPNLPKYNEIWDTNIVLSHLGKMEDTTLIQLSCKLCMLFLLLTAQRCQTLHLIEINDIELQPELHYLS